MSSILFGTSHIQEDSHRIQEEDAAVKRGSQWYAELAVYKTSLRGFHFDEGPDQAGYLRPILQEASFADT